MKKVLLPVVKFFRICFTFFLLTALQKRPGKIISDISRINCLKKTCCALTVLQISQNISFISLDL